MKKSLVAAVELTGLCDDERYVCGANNNGDDTFLDCNMHKGGAGVS